MVTVMQHPLMVLVDGTIHGDGYIVPIVIVAGSLESANSSILAARRHFKEVVGKKIRILL